MPGTAFPDDRPDGQEPDTTDAERTIRDALGAYAQRQSVADTGAGDPSGTPGFISVNPAEDTDELPASGIVHPDDAPRDDARVQRWADVAMWKAPEHTDPQHPRVEIGVMTSDPLGTMAYINGQYTGKFYRGPWEVSDEERREAWEAATVSKLSQAPLEWVQLSISFENVTRAFTHQLVRTRMAGYAQESLRFAVKGDVRGSTKLPPSLLDTKSICELVDDLEEAGLITNGMASDIVDEVIERNSSQRQRWRNRWDIALAAVDDAYTKNVDDGMPAEEARGLLPTDILTRVHQHIDLGTLIGLSGMRLCTQAQFEWREVFARLVEAIRAAQYRDLPQHGWQYDLISNAFRPVCFQAGRCVMKAKSDRWCSIRAQVDEFADAGIASSEWERDHPMTMHHPPLDGIKPYQWLADPTAARVAPGQEK